MDRKQRVLVADDEPAITSLVVDLLTYSGFETQGALGGVEALGFARAEPRPDLILLDVMMPDLDGRDVCRLIKMDEQLKDIPVILFSSADEVDVQWQRAGADAFLQKPFSITALPALVRRTLAAND